MNKKTLRIAGWALGLSIAVAGIGAAVGASYAVSGNEPMMVAAEDVSDTLTAGLFAATSTTYTDFSGVSVTSGAVYAGNNGKTSSGGIQLRSKNSNSGIVSTTSGGKVKAVSVTVESGSNTFDIYGSKTAYTSATDLYDAKKQGTKIGSGSTTGSVVLSSTEYEYIGIRSYSGALYLTNIVITWAQEDAFQVSFNPNGATGTMTSEEAGSGYIVPEPTFTPPDGRYFSYWKDASDNKYYAGDSIDVDADLALTAVWSDPVTLTYKANGGIGEDITETYGIGYKVTVSENTFAPAEGLDFDKWNSEADTSGDDRMAGSRFILDASTSLYAIWKPAAEGTRYNPYWADALKDLVKGGDSPTGEIYVKGYVKSASYSSQYKNSEIYLTTSKDNSSISNTNCFLLYHVDADEGVDLKTVAAGDFIVARGVSTLYGEQAEFTNGSDYVVEHNNIEFITVTGTPTKAIQYVGNVFDPSGLTITAKYHLGPTEPVISGIVWDELTEGIYPHGSYKGKEFDVEAVTVEPNTLTIDITGNSLTDNDFKSTDSWNHNGLVASGVYADGTDYDGEISWSYSPASPSEMGAGENQDLTITATASTGEFDSIVVKVNVEAVAVEITGIKALGEENPLENYSLDILRTNTEGVQLNASVYPDTALDKGLVYVSSNPSKISVSNTGLVELHDAVVGDKADITITSTGNTENGYDEVQAVVKVTVTRESQKVTIQKPAAWTKVTNASALQSGDLLVIASESKGKVMSSTISSSIAEEASATFSNGAISSELPVSAAQLTLGGSAGAWTLSNSSGEELGATAVKKIAWDSGTTTWSISIDDGNATIQNGTASNGRILHNVTNTRFTTYTSDTNSSMLLPQIYKYTGGESEMPISDDLYSAVISAEQNISCKSSGIGSTYDWGKVAEEFGEYEGNPQTFTFLDDSWVDLKYAVADENGNEVEQFLARYDYIVGKYKENDFLSRSGETVFSYDPEKTRTMDLLTASDESSSNVTFFVLVAAVSGLAVSAGIAFLRRKKEDR